MSASNPADVVEQTAQPILVFGRGWMADPATRERGGELGLRPGFGFWAVGRAGFLGDVPAGVAAAAIGFMSTEAVAGYWQVPEGFRRQDGFAAYASAAADWGREVLTGIDSARLARLDELARRVADAAAPSLGTLFAGWRLLAPMPGDPGGDVTVTLNVLRELRGGAHLIAVHAVGIGPHGSIMASDPPRGGVGWAETFGWSEPHPEPRPDKRAEAEALTSALLVPAYSALEGAEQGEFVELVREAEAAMPD